MKRAPSHVLALLAGGAMALGTALVQPGNPPGSGGSVRQTGAVANAADEDGATPVRERASSGLRRSDAFREAWELLAARDEPMAVRLANQRKLLAEWAEVDLAGAMDAAMAEAWDQEDGGNGDPAPLTEAFQKAFMENPLAAWKLIQSGRYGVGAQLLRREWVNSVCIKDGLLVISMLDELPMSLRQEAIGSAAVMAGRSPGKLDEILAKMATFPPGEATDQWIAWAAQSIPDGGDPTELRGQWAGAAPGPARNVAMLTWGASLRMADQDALAEEWAGIPDVERGDAAKAVLNQLNADSRGLLPALNLAMAAGEWDYLAKRAAELLGVRDGLGEQGLEEWVLTLPERPEAEPLFRAAMEQYMGSNPQRAREWIAGMPSDDWHTQQALAEYARRALGQGSGREATWALEQIKDPALKAKAMGGQDLIWTDPDE
ncbi:hypothetical protein [Luteolibacter sp. Populi]|uniref:hypothetical protein n=1 Tax=Luteolibacter sp. Populi TaxID=3230487 RepID=UPI003467853C